jgi:hypothetical protein
MHYAPYFYVDTTALSQDAPSGQKAVTVADGTKFRVSFPVEIFDNDNSEWNVVGSVNGNTLTMENNLANTYHVANGGSVDGPDPSFGQGVFAAAFAIDFLFLAYNAPQYSANQAAILDEISSLADFIVSQQVTNSEWFAYGGFWSAVGSDQCWSVDACRCIPSLLRAYALTNDGSYLESAILAATFLYTMQHQPVEQGVHDHYYGGFAQYIQTTDSGATWSPYMDIECLYGLIGLTMLANTYDIGNAATYNSMMSDLVGFLRYGFENLYLDFYPLPTGDGKWHRVGIGETQCYDDKA